MFSSLAWKLGVAAIVTVSIPLLPTIAAASNYTSDSGATLLLLNDDNWQGEYQTQINGKVWSGSITPGRVLGHNGNRTIYGTFNDAPAQVLNINDRKVCTGDFTATQVFEQDGYILNATWKTTGGNKNCPSIGQTSRLRLIEALPKPDRRRDFSWDNSKVWSGINKGQNIFHTWDRWHVTEDQLNCRIKPNGKIVKVYKIYDRFSALYDGRGFASSILGADNQETNPSTIPPQNIKGAPWIQTSDKCFVRSNAQYIEPISFGE